MPKVDLLPGSPIEVEYDGSIVAMKVAGIKDYGIVRSETLEMQFMEDDSSEWRDGPCVVRFAGIKYEGSLKRAYPPRPMEGPMGGKVLLIIKVKISDPNFWAKKGLSRRAK